MERIVKKTMFVRLFLFIFLVGVGTALPSLSKADVRVVVNNETGYDLGEVKYVQEVGEAKSVVGRTEQLGNGGNDTFNLQEGGDYRVYASLIMNGKTVYAKGNANNLRNGGQYRLTLKKVMVNQGGSGIRFINRSEFDAIK
jgi:hypothetical protein